MKNILTFFSILLIAVFAVGFASATTLFEDDFDDDDLFDDDGWGSEWESDYFETPNSVGVDAGTGTSATFDYDGTAYAWVEDDHAIYHEVDTTDHENIYFSYCRRTASTTSGDRLKIGWKTGAVSTDWSDWNELESIRELWDCSNYSLPSSAEDTTIYIAFFLDNGENDWGLIDDVAVTGQLDSTAPTVENITWDPEYPTCTDDVEICADIVDDLSNVSSVDLVWDSGTDSGSFSMVHDSGNTYCRTLSASTLSAIDAMTVEFDIEVEDWYGNDDTISDAGEFTFDCLAPTADADGPYSCDEGTSVTLDASASTDTVDTSLDFAWDLDDDGDYDDATGDMPSFSCVDDGTYDVSVEVTDDAGHTSTADSTVTVSNVDPEADAGGPYTGDEGSSVALSASVSDDGVLDTHTYAWDLDNDGDYDDATGSSASFACLDDSVNTIGVNITDDDGGYDTDSTTVTCENVDPVVDAGSDQTVDEGDDVTISPTWTDAGTLDTHTVSVNWDDGTINSLYTHNYCDGDDTFDVEVTVTDDDGGVGSDTLTITVNNVAPTFDNLPYATAYGVDGETFEYDVDASDVGCDDLEYSLESGEPSGMTIDSVTGEITWPDAEAGDYVVTVGVDDGDDLTTATLTIHIYDYAIDFEEGLNCFSIPLVPDYDNVSINNVLGDDVSMVAEKIWSYTYDEGLDKNVWKYNEPLTDGTRWTAFSSRVQEIEPGYGYYLFTNDSVTSYQDGKTMYGGFDLLPPYRPSVHLNHGDNLIGKYYLTDVPQFAQTLDLTGNDEVRHLAGQGLYDEEGEIASLMEPTDCYWASIHGEDVVEYWPSDADTEGFFAP